MMTKADKATVKNFVALVKRMDKEGERAIDRRHNVFIEVRASQ